MEQLVGLLIGILIAAVISGLVIWIVGKLNMGLSVDGFGWAMLAGLLIGVLNHLLDQFVVVGNQWVALIIDLVVAAVVIMIAGAMLKGLHVKGFMGAVLAAIGIAVVSFLLGMLGLMGAAAVSG